MTKRRVLVPVHIVERLLELDAMYANIAERHPEVLTGSLLRDTALALERLRLAVGHRIP